MSPFDINNTTVRHIPGNFRKKGLYAAYTSNPLTAEPDTIKDIAILETIARGKTIFKTP